MKYTSSSDEENNILNEKDYEVGVGPWEGGEENWPKDEKYDEKFLRNGDRRNVLDRYRYWKREAIIKGLDEN